MSKITMYVFVEISGGLYTVKTKQVTKLKRTFSPKMSKRQRKIFELGGGFNIEVQNIKTEFNVQSIAKHSPPPRLR